MTFWIALASAILSGVSIVLHVIAPKTTTTIDDKIAAYVDAALAKLK